MRRRTVRLGLAAGMAMLAAMGSAYSVARADVASLSETRAVPEHPVETRHSVQVGGRTLDYVAEAGRIAIRDVETAQARGYMGYIAYRVEGVAPRPVIFVWNGGPGSNSTILHFEVAGPRRGEGDRLVENPETWLADADLVFVDPIGTGFSRPVSAEAAGEFYGTVGDVASVTEFVRAWLLQHAAEERPVILAGESWGAGRAASVGYRLIRQGVPVKGLVLISGGDGLTTEYLPRPMATALRPIDLAPVALYHGRLDPALGADAETVRARARAWIEQTYLPALQSQDMSAAERAAVAADLARFTGVPRDSIDLATLSFTPRQHLRGLLADAGRTLNIFDMRLIEEPRSDFRKAIDRYLRHDLGYRTDLPYLGLQAAEAGYAPFDRYPQSVGSRWNYATIDATPEQVETAIREAVQKGGGPPRIGPPLPGTEEAVAQEPDLRVLVASGRYDSLASCARDEALKLRLPEPLAAAMTYRCYNGGHMFYRDEEARRLFRQDLADIVSSSLND